MDERLAVLRRELQRSGDQPQRLAPLVRAARRLIWPLIRPYHFHIMENLHNQGVAAGGALGEVESRLAHSIATLRPELLALRQSVEETGRAIATLTAQTAALTQDVAALREAAAAAAARREFDDGRWRAEVLALGHAVQSCRDQLVKDAQI